MITSIREDSKRDRANWCLLWSNF